MIQKIGPVILEAAEVLVEKQQKLNSLKVENKPGEGLVSEADLKSEEILLKGIKKHFPGHFILSEEDTYHSKDNFQKAKEAPECWAIDPLDGTNNYLSGLDYYAISIGYSEGSELKFGAVYLPATKEMFYANKGEGAFYQLGNETEKKLEPEEKPCKVFAQSSFISCLSVLRKNPEKLEAFHRVSEEALMVRRFGSAAADLCYTALGRFDGFWDRGLNPWDMHGGALICAEANLQVRNQLNSSFNPFDPAIMVGRKHLIDKLYQLVKPSLI